MYECRRCGHSFRLKTDLRRHVGRKVSCEARLEDVDPVEYLKTLETQSKEFTCDWCGASFKHASSLTHHVSSCTDKGSYARLHNFLRRFGHAALPVKQYVSMTKHDIIQLVTAVPFSSGHVGPATVNMNGNGDYVNGDYVNGDYVNGDYVNGDYVNGDYTNVYNVTLDFGSEKLKLTVDDLERLHRGNRHELVHQQPEGRASSCVPRRRLGIKRC